MDLFDTLTFAKILVGTTFLGTPTLIVLVSIISNLVSLSYHIPPPTSLTFKD
jgi:hypothetical protein